MRKRVCAYNLSRVTDVVKVSTIILVLAVTWLPLRAAEKIYQPTGLEKKQAMILFDKAQAAYEDGRYDEAARYFNDFQTLYPNHDKTKDILQILAAIAHKRQEYLKAAGLWERLYLMDPDQGGETALRKAIGLYLQMGLWDKARKLQQFLPENVAQPSQKVGAKSDKLVQDTTNGFEIEFE